MPTPALAAPADRSLFRGYRFPPEIIGQAVWLYFRFQLSLRDVQDLLAERGLIVSHESIRQWCDTFGPTFAAGLCKRRAGSAGYGRRDRGATYSRCGGRDLYAVFDALGRPCITSLDRRMVAIDLA